MNKALLTTVVLMLLVSPVIAKAASAQESPGSAPAMAPGPPEPSVAPEGPVSNIGAKGQRILCTSSRMGASNVVYPMVALYGDTLAGPGGANHSTCGIDYVPAPYTFIEMWVWWLPDPQEGLNGGEFKINYPTSTYIIQGPVTANEGILANGSLATGMVFVLTTSCARTWYWSHWQELFVKNMTSMTIQIVGHPDSGHTYTTDCMNDYCYFDATVLNNLSINASCSPGVGTKSVSWGTIKSLYTE